MTLVLIDADALGRERTGDETYVENLLRRLPAPEWVISIKFSPNGSRLITGGGGPTVGSKRSVTVWGVPPGLLR